MTRFGENSLATLEMVLSWRDEGAEHEERFVARRVNVWRDIFPPGLVEALDGKTVGDRVVLEYGPGQAVPGHRPDRILERPVSSFARRVVAGRTIRPKVGRFYPQGLLTGLLGIYPQTMNPFRILDRSLTGRWSQ